MTLINTIHTNRWDQHEDAQRQRHTSSPGWADGSAAQWPDQRNPPLMRQSCCSEFICCLMLSNSHSVLHTHLRRPLSLSPGPATAAPMTPSPLTYLSITLEGWISARTWTPTPDCFSVLTVWRQHNETKTKHPQLKVQLFLPLAQSESWEARVALTMTARGGMRGEEACEVADLSEDICGICWEGTLCNHRRVTEGRAEWFLPACVLTKVAESKFTESVPWFFAVRRNQ